MRGAGKTARRFSRRCLAAQPGGAVGQSPRPPRCSGPGAAGAGGESGGPVALAYVTGAFLRQHYAEPVTTPGSPTRLEGIHGWVLGWEWARGGKPASLSLINQTLHAIHVRAEGPLSFQPEGPANASVPMDPVNYLLQHGYALLIINQPDSRFWTFQWIEGGWLLALSLLLLAGTLWLVRRRAA